MKNKKYILLLSLMLQLTACMFTQPDYLTMVNAAELKQMMQNEDIFLLDVHIPEQKHIKGTDAFIPFNQLVENQAKLPANKNTPIYLYCESGPMGNAAARTLHDMGYTHLFNLIGGADSWRDSGFEFE